MIEPTWQTEDGVIRLYCGDCLDVLPYVGEFDCIITDPPYGISHGCNFAGRGRSKLAQCNDYEDVIGDGVPFDPSLLLSFDKPTILWGGNHFASRLPSSSGWLVWDKERPDDLDQATCELAWSNCVKGVRRLRHLWHGMMRASEHGENYHPTQKPVALYRWILSLRWIPSGRVLDPYMGAGPLAIACIERGTPYTGIELSPTHFETAKRRIIAAIADEKANLFRRQIDGERAAEKQLSLI